MKDFIESEYIEVKDLYQAVSGDRSWDARYSEYRDPAQENKQLQPYRASFPIIHKWKCTDREEDTWATKSIEINDKHLRAKIEQIFADVPELNFDVDVLRFTPPFAPFLNKWTEFSTATESEADGRLRNLLQHLHDITAPHVLPILDKINKARASQTIDWELLKSSCVPGELVYGQWLRQPQAYRITGTDTWWDDGRQYLKLSVEYYDWDGQRCGFGRTDLTTVDFCGEIPLSKLKFVPFKFLKRPELIREQLIGRGKVFEKMIGYQFKHYSGTKMVKLPNGCIKMGQLTGRVIVDAFAYHKFFEEQWLPEEKKSEDDMSDSDSDVIVESDEDKGDSNGRNEIRKPFTEEHYLLSIATIKGFDIENRDWCQFYLHGFSDIVFNDNAYEKLVLEESEKKMILAFSEQLRNSKSRFDDFIKNKGRGVLMLLYGQPGTGKTLTAESIAERAHLPLYAVAAGEIGHDADKADQTLKVVLECCKLWNAVLLLDEADVFLEARGTDSLSRNEMVSVFLRRLEYFGGLSFLTTNRPRSIDPAFESRLDLIIPYPDLDVAARRSIWTTFVEHVGAMGKGHGIQQKDFDVLAQYKCNGREIKNIVKIARMLANRDKTRLTIDHVHTVLKLRIKAAKSLGTGQFQ